MPRIFFFMNAYSEGMSGGDLHFIEVAKRLEGYDKIVITSILGKKACEDRNLDVKYLVTSREQHFRNVYFTYVKRINNALLLKINAAKGDIIYSTSDSLPDILPVMLIKIMNPDVIWLNCIFHLVPSCFERPGSKVHNFFSHLAQKFSLVVIRKWSDLVLVDNNALKASLVERKFLASRIFITSMGIDQDIVNSVPMPERKEYDACFLARIHSSKGIFDLVKIWKAVTDTRNGARLAVIGDGHPKMIERLKSEISKNNLGNNILLLGFLESRDALRTVKASKIFIFPSYEEGWGIAICEAMACGLPVIAYNLPVYDEVFPTGLIQVQKGDHQTFAQKILELLSDNDEYEKLSKEALRMGNIYQWGNVAERELDLIKKVGKID